MHRFLKKPVLAAVAAVAVAFSLTACVPENGTSGANQERATGNSNYDKLVAAQPAETMNYSPTREAKNGWIRTWGSPNKLSYVYIRGADSKPTGYYIFKGLPVNYCTALTPPSQVETYGSDGNGTVVMPRPSVDGTFSTGNGGCERYYGFDAVTGAYTEFSTGANQSYQLFDQPLPAGNVPNVQPLGFATLDAVKQEGPR